MPEMKQFFDFDTYSPAEIAAKVESVGVTKARMPLLPMAMLGMLAGGFIGLGALYYTLVVSDASLGFAASRVLGGVVFSLGLILVVVGGAELFTGNNMLAMAWADGKISSREVMRNWVVVYVANAIGAVGLAAVVYWSGHATFNGGAVAQQYLKIAAAKTALPFAEAFFKGMLCHPPGCPRGLVLLVGGGGGGAGKEEQEGRRRQCEHHARQAPAAKNSPLISKRCHHWLNVSIFGRFNPPISGPETAAINEVVDQRHQGAAAHDVAQRDRHQIGGETRPVEGRQIHAGRSFDSTAQKNSQ